MIIGLCWLWKFSPCQFKETAASKVINDMITLDYTLVQKSSLGKPTIQGLISFNKSCLDKQDNPIYSTTTRKARAIEQVMAL